MEPENTQPSKRKDLRIFLDVEEREILAELMASNEYVKATGMSVRQLVRFAVRHLPYFLAHDEVITPPRLRASIDTQKKEREPVQEPLRRGRKSKEEMEEEQKKKKEMLCAVMNGVSEYGSCRYIRYEITPTGRFEQFEITTPLSNLTQDEVDNQFFPSAAAYKAALEAAQASTEPPEGEVFGDPTQP